jgi:hypothetical protein
LAGLRRQTVIDRDYHPGASLRGDVVIRDGNSNLARYRILSAMAHLAATRRLRRRRDGRAKGRSLLRLLMPGRAGTTSVLAGEAAPDPVKLAVLAIDTVAGASMRAAFTGTEVCIAAPDEATASIFRAALAQTARTRTTDRLIRVTVG